MQIESRVTQTDRLTFFFEYEGEGLMLYLLKGKFVKFLCILTLSDFHYLVQTH